MLSTTAPAHLFIQQADHPGPVLSSVLGTETNGTHSSPASYVDHFCLAEDKLRNDITMYSGKARVAETTSGWSKPKTHPKVTRTGLVKNG